MQNIPVELPSGSGYDIYGLRQISFVKQFYKQIYFSHLNFFFSACNCKQITQGLKIYEIPPFRGHSVQNSFIKKHAFSGYDIRFFIQIVCVL